MYCMCLCYVVVLVNLHSLIHIINEICIYLYMHTLLCWGQWHTNYIAWFSISEIHSFGPAKQSLYVLECHAITTIPAHA